jgi:DnaJ-class molecular chaperone
VEASIYPRSFYAILKVSEDADPAAIRHAYRVLARRYHPDAGSGSSTQRFQDATEAYDVLSDPQRRHDYDIDLARSRAHSHVRPEPLIPETPTQLRFHHSSFGVEHEIIRVFQMFDDIFGQIW